MSSLKRTARRWVALSTAVATVLPWGASVMAGNAPSQYTGGGTGTAQQPVSGLFSNGFVPTITVGGSTLELDFNTGATGYTATDDLAGALSLNEIQLNYAASGAGVGTITAGSGNSLDFVANGTVNPTIFQDGNTAFTISAPIQLGASGGSTATSLIFTGIGTGAETLSGGITSNNSAANGLTFDGNNTITLSGANSYGGATTLTSGGLVLDFSQASSPSTGIINGGGTATALVLGGGTLTLNGSTGAVSQSFSGTSLAGGSSFVKFTNAANGETLNLGTLARAAKAGTLDVTLATGATVTAGATANNATGIIGGWATMGGADWATVSGGNLAAYTGYSAFAATGTTNANNYLQAGALTLTGSESVNSLKITGTGTLALGTFNLTFNGANGGLLYAPGATSAYTISGGGNIGAGAGAEFIVNVQSGGTLTISSTIVTANNGSLTKSGAGTLLLSGTNTYTGGTVIDGGILKLGNQTSNATTNLGSPTGTLVTVNPGGALDLNGIPIQSQTTAVVINGFGTGAAGTGAVINSGGALTNAGLPNVTLGSNASLGDPTIRFDIEGTLNAAGFTLYKVGGNYVSMKGATTNLNNLVIAGGSWEVSNATGMGNDAVTTTDTVQTGGTLTFFNANQSYFTTINLNGGIIGTGSGNVTLNGPVNLGSGSSNTMNGTMTFNGVIAGAGALKVTGGNETFSGSVPNTYSGGTTLSAGTLNAASAGALGTGNFAFSGGTFNQTVDNVLSGPAQTVTVSGGTLTLGNNSYGGGTSVTGGTLRLSNGTGASSATGSGNILLGSGATLSSGAGTTGSALGTVNGPASGNATIAPGGLFTSDNANIGTIDLSALNATAFTTLNFDLTTPGGPDDLINVLNANGLTVTGTVPITLGQAPATSGLYQLVSFNSTTTPTFTSSNFTVTPSSTGSGRLTYAISVDNPGGGNQWYIDLNATGSSGGITTVFNNPTPATDTAGNGDWTNAVNWSNGVPGIAGDNATINNGATAALTIDLNGQQHVGSLTFANSGSGSYTLAAGTGTGSGLFLDTGSSAPATLANSTNNNTITAPVVLDSSTNVITASGTTLTMGGVISGAGSLTSSASSAGILQLNVANTYSGGTNINGGTIQLGIAGAMPTAGPVVINSGGTLDINNFAVTNAMTINGTGVGGNGVIVNSSGAGNPTMSGAITLGSNSTLGVAHNFVITGVISGPNALTVVGPGQLSLNASNSFSGGLIVGNGTGVITAGTATTPPVITTPNGFIATSTGDLGFGAANAPVTLNNGSNVYVNVAAQVTDTHLFSVNGTVAFGNVQNQKWLISPSNAISGPGTATIIRYSQATGATTTNDFQLAGNNSGYSGAWILEGGATEVQTPFALGNNASTNTVMLYSTAGTGSDEIASNNMPQAITSAGPANLSSVISTDNGASFSTATFTGPITLDFNTYVRMGPYFATTSQNVAFTNTLSGPGAITFLTPNGGALNGQELILSGNNIAYTGKFTIPANVALVAASPNALGSATSTGPGLGDLSNTVTLAGGAALDIQAAIPSTENIVGVQGTGIGGTGAIRNTGSTNGSYGGNVALSAATTFGIGSTGNLGFSGAFSGGFAATGVGPGTGALIFNNSGNGFSSYTVASGITESDADGSLGTGDTVTVGAATGSANATLQLGGSTGSILSNGITVASGNTGTSTLTGVNPAGTTVSYNGSVTLNKNVVLDSTFAQAITAFPNGISGTGSVTKGPGRGTVQINSASYTGTTTINSGAIQFGGSNSIGNVTTNNGATLEGTPATTTSLAGSVTMNSGGLLAPGGVGNTLAGTVFSIGGNLTLNNASSVYFDFAGGGAGLANEEITLTGGSSALAVNGDPIFQFANEPSSQGTYLLLNDTNTAGVPSNTVLAQILLPAAPTGDTYSLVNDGSGNVNLVVAAASGTSAIFMPGGVNPVGGNATTYSFNVGANWSTGTVPNGSGSSATFPNITPGVNTPPPAINTAAVSLDAPQHVGTLTLDPGAGNVYAFTAGTGGSLSVDSNVTNSSGANTFAAPLGFGGPTTVFVDTTSDPASSLTITSAGSLTSNSAVTKTGGGLFNVAGQAVLGGGGTVSAGTLQFSNTAAGVAANSLKGTFAVAPGASLQGSAVASSVAGSLSNGLAGAAISLANGATLTLNPQDTTAAAGMFVRQLGAGTTGTNTAAENYTVGATATSLVTATSSASSQTNLFASATANTGYDLAGKVFIPNTGAYTFGLNADDGARLFIDGQLAVNDDTGAGKGQTNTNNAITVQQTGLAVTLSAGYHDFNLEYTNTGGSGAVEVTYTGAGTINGTINTTAVTAATPLTYTGILQPVIQTAAFNPLPNAITLANNVAVAAGASATVDVGSTNSATQYFVGVELSPSSGAGITLNSGATLNVIASSAALNPAANLDAGQFLASASTLLVGGGTITVNNAPDLYAGGLNDGGTAVTLIKTGAGQLVLDNSVGTDSLASGSIITIQQGRLHLYGSNNLLGSAGLSLAGTGGNVPDVVLDTHNGGYVLDNAITVSSNAKIEDWNDTVTTTLGGANGISIASGDTLTFDAIGGSANGAAAGATLTLAGAVTGAGSIAVQSTDYGSTTTLPGNVIFQNVANNFSGGLALNSGTVTANAPASASNTVLGTGAITIATPTTLTPTLLNLLSNGTGNGGTISYGGATPNPVTIAGTGTTTINVANNGTGIGNTEALGALTIDSARLNVTGANGYGLSFPSATFLSTPTFAPSTANLVLGPISGGTGLNLAGSGSGTLLLTSANNTYAGPTTVTGGTLRIGATNALPTLQNLVMTAGTFDLFGNNQTVAGLAGSGSTLTNTGAALGTFTVPSTLSGIPNNYFVGNINNGLGTVALNVTGGSTLLAGASSNFTGGTVLGPGAVLSLSLANPLGSGSLTINGGTLRLTGQAATGAVQGLTTQLYNVAPPNPNNNFNTLSAFNTYLNGLTPTVTTVSTAGGKDNLNFSNSNYGTAATFNTAPSGTGDTTASYGFTPATNYQVRFVGDIYVPVAGTATFSTTSDDGSVLFVNNQDAPVVSNNAFQGATTRTGTYTFADAGFYPIEVGYFQGTGGAGLNVQMTLPGQPLQTIFNSELYTAGFGATQGYSNPVSITADSNIDVTNSLAATVGATTIGSNTLSVTSGDATTSPYGLTTGPVVLTGSPTFAVANSAGGGAGTLTLPGISGGPTNLITKTGPGILSITGPGTYGGGTNVQGGTLLVSNATGSATGPGAVNVGDSSNANGFQGILGGSGKIAGTVNVYNGSTISAGTNSSLTPGVASAVATLTTGQQSWYGGGSYTWKLANAATSGGGAGTPGTDWDLLSMSTLNLDSSTGTTPFQINAVPMNGTVNNFNFGNTYTWPIAHAADASLANLSANQLAQNFVLNTAAVNTAMGTVPANYSLESMADPSGSELDVVYSPAPEPTSLAMMGLGAAGLLLRRRRRNGRSDAK